MKLLFIEASSINPLKATYNKIVLVLLSRNMNGTLESFCEFVICSQYPPIKSDCSDKDSVDRSWCFFVFCKYSVQEYCNVIH